MDNVERRAVLTLVCKRQNCFAKKLLYDNDICWCAGDKSIDVVLAKASFIIVGTQV